MRKETKEILIVGGFVVLAAALFITGAILNYISDTKRNNEIRELRSRIEKIEASREE